MNALLTRGLTLALLAAAAPGSASEAFLLRYQFEAGDAIASRVAHRALTETTMNGVTQAVETRTDSTKTWSVVDVDAEGRATLEQSVDDVTMTSRASDRGEVRWSSADPAAPPARRPTPARASRQ